MKNVIKLVKVAANQSRERNAASLRFVAAIVLMLGLLPLSAQKNTWTIGLYTGTQGQLITSHEQHYMRTIYDYKTDDYTIIDEWDSPIMGLKHVFSNIPPIELTAKYNVKNRFSIASGVGYRSYFIKMKNALDYTFRTDYIQVPIIFQYDIPLKKKGFSLFAQWGIGLEFNVYSKETVSLIGYQEPFLDKIIQGSSFTDITNNASVGGGRVNFLLHSGIGISYQFNSGIGLSLLGRYNIGTYTNKVSYHLKLIELPNGFVERETKELLRSRSESWNVLLGVTYTFKQKKKER